jgi:integrase
MNCVHFVQMGRQKPFNLHKRRVVLQSGRASTVYYFSLNPPSGLSLAICRNFRRKSTGKSTKADAERYVLEAIESLKRLDGRRKAEKTLREYASPYMDYNRCPHVARLREEGKSITRNHVRNQKYTLDRHILTDPIVEMQIGEIRRGDILAFRTRLVNRIGNTRTVQVVMGVLKVIFKEATFREDIDRNPTEGFGKIKYDEEKVGVFSVEELGELFKECPGPFRDRDVYTAFLLAATCGMRRGEILALTWGQIDFENRSIRVDRAMKSESPLEIGLPKWNKVRTTFLPEKTRGALEILMGNVEHLRPDLLVFSNSDGTIRKHTWWTKNFKAAMTKAGIYEKVVPPGTADGEPAAETRYENTRNLRPHSFRHSLNTILRDSGADAGKIRAALGWAGPRIQETYTHWEEMSLDEERRAVDELF